MYKTALLSALFFTIAIHSLMADLPTWETNLIYQQSSVGVNVSVMVAAGPVAGKAVGVWSDVNTYAPYYSIYTAEDCTSGPISLVVENGTNSVGVYDNIYVVAGPAAGQLMAAWSDSYGEVPYFSIYDNNTWTTGTIPLNGSNGAYNDVTLASGPNSGEIIAAWTNVGDGNHPYYSIYSGGNWTTGSIALGTSTAVKNNVFVSSGPSTGTVAAAWADRFTGLPYYSIYSNGSWTTATIPLGTSSGVANDVIIIQNPINGQLLATWSDSETQASFFSIYSNGVWSSGVIPLGTSAGVLNDVYASTGPTSNGFIATWGDKTSHEAYYSVYSSGTWSTPATIPLNISVGVYHDVAIAKIMGTGGLITAWSNLVNFHDGYYSILPSSLPEPPVNGSGKRIKNRFALEIEWYNQLEWSASPSEGVSGYNIRRNGILIASDLDQLTYQDHNRPKVGVDLYVITSVDGDGNESPDGLEIIVQ